MVALVEQYVGHEFGWDLKLTLRAPDARQAQPGRHGRLGWTTWVGSRPRTQAAELLLHPISAMRAARRRPTPTPPH